jgi:4-carboxymuconolactone decarboxylase
MRVPTLERDQMNAAQRAAYDGTVAGKRGRMAPPHMVWLHSPEFLDRAQRVGEFIRFDTCLPAPLLEMAILITGRHFGSHYEWYAHRKLAEAAGLDGAIIDAIRDGRTPALADAGARAIYDYATSLLRTRKVSQAQHDAVVAEFGDRGVVELVGTVGYYALVSLTLNAFEVPLPAGEKSEIPGP